MIDGSHLPYDENVALTRSVVEYAHQFDVTVEGELGVLAGIEDDVVAEHHTYTEPEEVVDFVSKTGVDSLAISIGTSHGANKFTPEQCHRDANGILVPPPSALISSLRSKSRSLASPSYSTVLPAYPRTKSLRSTSSVVPSRMLSVSPKSSSVRLLRALSARSTSTLTAVSL